jgi:hypothetical protein
MPLTSSLALKFAELGPVLVFCTQPDFVKAMANSLKYRLRLLSLIEGSMPPYFSGAVENWSAKLGEGYLGLTLCRLVSVWHRRPLWRAPRSRSKGG